MPKFLLKKMGKYWLALLVLPLFLFSPFLLFAQGACSSINFTSDIQTACAPGLINFRAIGAPQGSEFYWNFGSGLLKASDTVFKSFSATGSYTIKLLVKLPDGTFCDTIIKTNFITVRPSPNPKVYATQQVLCNGPGPVTFRDSTPNVISRDWTIDGYYTPNAVDTIIHNFNSLGNKSLTLKVKNSYGCVGIFNQSDYIKIFETFEVSFCVNALKKGNTMTATFTPYLIPHGQSITSYLWEFPGGSPSSSSLPNPTIVYPFSNTLSERVKLTITTPTGCKYFHEKPDFIKNFFSVSKSILCVDDTVSVFDYASTNGRQVGWNFYGSELDSVTPTRYIIHHPTPGNKRVDLNYTYCLTCCPNQVRYEDVFVVKPPMAKISSLDRYQCAPPARVHFKNESIEAPGINFYEWRFYDSAGVLVPGSLIGPISKIDTAFTFLKKGVYDVELKVIGTNGCIHTKRFEKFVRIGKPEANFAADETVVCTKKSITLSDSTKPEPPLTNLYLYEWKIQHADSPNVKKSFTSRNASFVPQVPGKYHVTFIVRNGATCVDTITKYYYLEVKGVDAEIIPSKNLVCKNDPVELKAHLKGVYPVSSKDSLRFSWSGLPDTGVVFSDPDSSVTTMSYKFPTCYTTVVKISDNYGCELELRSIGGVCVGTVPDYKMDSFPCANETIQLTDLSTLNPTEWHWSTDPPSSKFLPSDRDTNPTVIFYEDTCYKFRLITGKPIDGVMCYDTITKTICVSAPKASYVTPDTLKYCAPVAVQFISHSVNADKYFWDFGDGTTLETTNQNPFHTYEKNKVSGYNVTLIAINDDGCQDTLTRKNHIKILGPEPGFTLDRDSACERLEVNFTNTSTNTTSFLFDYGDGSLPDSNKINKHLYQLPAGVADSGLFLPTLIARDASNCTSTFTDTVLIFPRPVPDFTADSSVGCPPFTVQFHDNSIAAIDWRWDLDGDGIIDSSGPNPTFTYKTVDTIDVTLYIYGKGGCKDSITIKDFVKILQVPQAKFMVSKHRGCDTLAVSFVNQSQFFTEFNLDYGDGTQTVENQLLPHTYRFNYGSGLDSMIFFPTLTAKNAAGCAIEYKDTIILYPNPVASISWDTTTGCEPLKVQFTGPAGKYIYRWDFNNDGTVDATTANPLHSFSHGLYTVALEVEGPSGCKARNEYPRLISVRESPIANFIHTDTALCSGDSVIFWDQTKSPYRLARFGWNFGDPKTTLDTSTVRNPDPYFYVDPGTYTITLAIEDEFGCKDTVVQPNLIWVKDTAAPPVNDLLYVTVIRNSKMHGDSNHVQVVWNKSSLDDFEEYKLLRSIDATNPFYTTSNISETTYIDSSNTDPSFKSYCYSLQVMDECGNISAISGEHCSVVLKAYTQGPSQNLLSWSPYKGWNNVVRYEIYRAFGNEPYQLLTSVPGSERSYLDENLCDTTYCYFVQAISPSGLVSGSNYACNHAPYEYQESPLELYLATVADSFSTVINWEQGKQKNVKRYIIDRYTDWTGWKEEYSHTRNTYYSDYSVQVNQNPYRYRISVEDLCGYVSPLSNEATTIYLEADILKNQVYQVHLKWNPYEEWLSGVDQYIVQLMQPNGSFKTIGITDGTQTSFIDTALHQHIESAWCYRVKAVENFVEADTSVSNIACTIYPSSVYVPSAFSPNGDGINDFFMINPVSIYRLTGEKRLEFTMKIFDRWGQLVYETNDWKKGWDGNYNGQPAQQGIYVYVVKGAGYDSEDYILRGTVTLLR